MRSGDRRRLLRTPCIGICSTTYGDLVCRGCKRFAHEVTGWNGYRESQRDVVWARLHGLLAESVRVFVTIVDEPRLQAAAQDARVPDAELLPAEVLAYQTMRRRGLPLATLGLAPRDSPVAGMDPAEDAREALRRIDREFYARSRAYYEASFKTLT